MAQCSIVSSTFIFANDFKLLGLSTRFFPVQFKYSNQTELATEKRSSSYFRRQNVTFRLVRNCVGNISQKYSRVLYGLSSITATRTLQLLERKEVVKWVVGNGHTKKVKINLP